MNNKCLTLLISIILFLYALGSKAMGSLSNMMFSNFNLSGVSVVLCIGQDEDGLIWLGTQNDGLYRFDGYHSYPCIISPSGNATVNGMAMRGDSIYMATNNGLVILDRKSMTTVAPLGVKSFEARTLVLQNNNVVFGGSKGLWLYNTVNGKVRKLNINIPEIYSLALDGQDILIGTIHGLYRLHGNTIREVSIGKELKSYVSNIVADRFRPHCFFIGAYGRLFYYNALTGVFTEDVRLGECSVKSISQDRAGRLFIGTDNGLYVSDNGKYLRFLHEERNGRSLGNNIVWNTFFDYTDKLWLGTDIGFSMAGLSPTFTYYPLSQLTHVSSGNFLQTVFADNNKTLWLGGSNGLIHYSGKGKSIWYRKDNPSHYITHNRIRDVWQDSDGYIWISTDLGVNLVNKDGSLRNFILTDLNGHNTTRWAYGITEDSQNRLWIASYDGVFVVSKQRLLSSSGGDIVAEGNLLKQVFANQILNVGKTFIWVRSSSGLFVINATTKKPRQVSKTAMTAMVKDHNGNVWSCGDEFFWQFTKDGKLIKKISIGKEGKDVTSMMTIGKNVWTLSDDELRIIHPDGRVDAIRIPGLKANAACYGIKDGRLYLGGNDGVMVINPRNLLSLQERKIILTQVVVNGKALLPSDERWNDGKLRLMHNEGNLTLSFSDLPYLDGLPQVYAYRLKGIDKVWHRLDIRTMEVSYAGLAPDSYIFELSIIDGQGNPRKIVYSTSIKVLQPWYFSWYMRVLYLMIILGVAFLVYHIYSIRRNLRQEQKDREQVTKELHRRMDFYTKFYGGIRRELISVMVNAGDLISGRRKDRKNGLLEIRHAAHQLNNVLSEASVAIDERADADNRRTVDIVDVLRQTVDELQVEAGAKGIGIQFNSNIKGVTADIDVSKLDIAFSKLVLFCSNHVPRSQDVDIVLTSATDNKCLTINIIGVGMHISDNDVVSQLPVFLNYIEEEGGKTEVASFDEGDGFCLTLPTNGMAELEVNEEDEQKVKIKPRITDVDEKLMSEIRQVINDHIDDSDLNVTRLQELLGIGNKMLYRKVKLMTGMNPVEYIREVRLKRAAELLTSGQFSISEVMYMVGFSNRGYFSKCFHRSFGITPTEYQEKNL